MIRGGQSAGWARASLPPRDKSGVGLQIRARPVREQKLDERRVPPFRRVMENRKPMLPARIDVGSVRQEQRGVAVRLNGREEQRRLPLLVPVVVDIGPGGNKQSEHLGIGIVSRDMQNRPAIGRVLAN